MYVTYSTAFNHMQLEVKCRNNFLFEILIKEEMTNAQLMEQERNSYCLAIRQSCIATLIATCFTERKLLVQYHNVTEGGVMPVLKRLNDYIKHDYFFIFIYCTRGLAYNK